ncbi:MAG: hypothetical protein GY749_20955 [Desulfobacteraceae bacterium]|nr:hypothetical protein [Desulfobacteraceae bacterium]
MRERSQQIGKLYQRNVKKWLTHSLLFGLNAESWGDAYDITKKATEIGGVFFDFSLKLIKQGNTEPVRIMYAECKYRQESGGNINSELNRFVENVFKAISNATDEEKKHSEFLFVSNIPPDQWRNYVNNKVKYLSNCLGGNQTADQNIINCMINSFNILILSEKIIGG